MRLHQSEWAVVEKQEQRQRLETVTETRVMIATARTKYNRARDAGKDVRGWTAERVLSVNAGFGKLCKALNNELTWRMLNRKERAFVADAVAYAKAAK